MYVTRDFPPPAEIKQIISLNTSLSVNLTVGLPPGVKLSSLHTRTVIHRVSVQTLSQS